MTIRRRRCCVSMRGKDMLGLDRITYSPDIMAGQACIRGLRIPASLVINLVANGMSTADILEAYPDLEPEDIRQSLEYASRLARDHIFPHQSERTG